VQYWMFHVPTFVILLGDYRSNGPCKSGLDRFSNFASPGSADSVLDPVVMNHDEPFPCIHLRITG